MTKWSHDSIRLQVLELLGRHKVMAAKEIGGILGLDRSTLFPALRRMEDERDIVAEMKDGWRVFVMRSPLKRALRMLGG